MILYKKSLTGTGIQVIILLMLYSTQFLTKISDKNNVLEQMTNYFSYYDLSLFILFLIPLLLFSLAVFVPDNIVYKDVRMTKKRLYFCKCLRILLEISKFVIVYFLIGLPVFFIFPDRIVLSEYTKQTLIFFLMSIISVQFYMLIELINGSNRKFMNSFLSVSLIMGSYFLFKDYFSFFNLSYIYYVLNVETNSVIYLPILITIPLAQCILNYELFTRKDFL